MGLFDYVHCELPLPVGGSWTYQTKDTDDPFMEHYTITVAGRFVRHFREFETTPKAERRYPNEPEGSLLGLCGMIRPKIGTERDIDTGFDGDLCLIPDIGVESPEADDLEYRFTFRVGQCTEICQWINGCWSHIWPGLEAEE
jgi:hypothetical protein